MRVLHVIPSFGIGGAERQLSILAPALADAGMDVHVAFLREGSNFDRVRASRARLHRVAAAGNYDPLMLPRLASLIRALRPVVVQTWLTQMDIAGGVAAAAARAPLVLSERSSASMYPLTAKNIARRWVGCRAAAIVANSEGGANYWRALRPRGPVSVIRNCVVVDDDAAPADVATLGLDRDARLILFAGRLSAEKNLGHLLPALDVVLASSERYHAVLFGEGPLRAELDAWSGRTPHASRVRVLPFTNQLPSWMRRAELFVTVSELEGEPNAVLEAMALGCPLVLSDVPQHRELLDESAAMFCDHRSSASIASALISVLDDPEAARQRAVVARSRLGARSIDAAVRAYGTLYASLARTANG
jgi:glycosyltransferase involved in cell wall biosynthesis